MRGGVSSSACSFTDKYKKEISANTKSIKDNEDLDKKQQKEIDSNTMINGWQESAITANKQDIVVNKQDILKLYFMLENYYALKSDLSEFITSADIPTNVSYFINDKDYTTSGDINTFKVNEVDIKLNREDYINDKKKFVLSGDNITKLFNDAQYVTSGEAESTYQKIGDYITNEELEAKKYISAWTETDPVYEADKEFIAFKTDLKTKLSEFINDKEFVSSGFTEDTYLHKNTKFKTISGISVVGDGDISLKTIGGEGIIGSGDVSFKTIEYNNIVGKGNIDLKTINGESIIGDGDISIDLSLFMLVEELPTKDIKDNKIYLLQSENTGSSNVYTEYMYVNNEWEILGQFYTDVDLSDYITDKILEDTLKDYLLTSSAETIYATIDNLNDESTRAKNKEAELETNLEKKVESVTIAKDDDLNVYNLVVDGINSGLITIPTDKYLKNVLYSSTSNTLDFLFETDDGEELKQIDVTEFASKYKGGDGITVNSDGIISLAYGLSGGSIQASDTGSAITFSQEVFYKEDENNNYSKAVIEYPSFAGEYFSLNGGHVSLNTENIAYKSDTLQGYGIEDAYTKKEVDAKISGSGIFDASLYYTKEEVNSLGYITSDSLEPYATTEFVESAATELNESKLDKSTYETDKATFALKDDIPEIPLFRTINGEKITGDTSDITLDLSMFIMVNSLPVENIKTDKIYLVPSESSSAGNAYTKWSYVNGAWENMGNYESEVVMTDYYKKDEVDTLLKEKQDEIDKLKENIEDLQNQITQFERNVAYLFTVLNKAKYPSE